MFFISTSQNLNVLNIILMTMALIGGFFIVGKIHWVFYSVLCFYIMNNLGLYLMYHRFYAHKSFVFKFKFLEFILLFLAIITARGSPLAWVSIHRLHHKHSDTAADPHDRSGKQYKLPIFLQFPGTPQVNIFSIKDLMSKLHLFIHNYYILIIFLFAITLATINFIWFYFFWLLPVVMIHITQQSFNYWAHKIGYRNYETKDNSKNNFFLFPLLLGECWHNNHHHNPKNYSTQIKKHELDPLSWFIILIGIKNENKLNDK